MAEKIIIVGAGIGGLAAGYWLKKKGFEVEILEASDRPAGRMITIKRNGDMVDVGAQFYHSNYHYAFELMNAMNMNKTKRDMPFKIKFALKDGSYYLYDRRIPYMKILGPAGNLGMYWFILKYCVLGKKFPKYRIEADIPEYDNVLVMDAFKSRFDRLLKDYFVTVLSMGSTSGMPELMSLYHYVKMFRGMAISKHIVLTHGVASLAEELAKHVPVLYESPVRKIVMEKGRAVGVQMEGNGSIKKAAHVIVAVTPSVMADIMPDELDEERGFFQSLPYVQFPMPVFFLDRPINKDIWCYFNDPGLKRTFVFAIDQHSKIPEMIPSGKSILTGWAVYPETLRLVNMPDEEIIKIASKDIELMIPGFSKWIEEVKIFRHSYVNGLYPPGEYRKILDFSKKAKKLDGVSFVSAELHGTAIEGALCSAADAVERIIIGGKK